MRRQSVRTRSHSCRWCANRQCGHILAKVFRTPYGLLFVSMWQDYRAPFGPIEVNGRPYKAPPPDAPPSVASLMAVLSPPPSSERYAVLDLLSYEPPPGTPDHPPLMIRCEEHGDAVLDRAELLRRVRGTNRKWAVPLSAVRLACTLEHN